MLDEARAQVLRALDLDRRLEPVAPGGAPTRPAIERYTGVLYRELDAASLDAPARRRLNQQVLIASGVFGLVAPRDPVPDYRTKMGDRVTPMGRLATWWRPQLTAALAERVKSAEVWDLLPAEHAAALDWNQLQPRRRVTVRFVDHRGVTVSHWNKLLKGSLVRWLVEGGGPDLAAFEHPQGYRLDRRASRSVAARDELVLRQEP